MKKFAEPWAWRQMRRATTTNRAIGLVKTSELGGPVSGATQPFRPNFNEHQPNIGQRNTERQPNVALHILELPYPEIDDRIYKDSEATEKNAWLQNNYIHLPLIDLTGACEFTVSKNGSWEPDDIEVTTSEPTVISALLDLCRAAVTPLEDLQPAPTNYSDLNGRRSDMAEYSANFFHWMHNMLVTVDSGHTYTAGYISTIEFEGQYKGQAPDKCTIRATGMLDWLLTMPALAAGQLIDQTPPGLYTAQIPLQSDLVGINKYKYNTHQLPTLDFIPLVKSEQVAGYTLTGTRKELAEKILSNALKNLHALAVTAPMFNGGSNIAPPRPDIIAANADKRNDSYGFLPQSGITLSWDEDPYFSRYISSPYNINAYFDDDTTTVTLNDSKTVGELLQEVLGDEWRCDVLPVLRTGEIHIHFTQVKARAM